jgi:nitroimidazol reductase NimA-like FMN-containing flavoprotein (pyridoxamine 5'-phosphate oxidase superfamily)
MLINEMTETECRTVLAGASLGRVGCSLDGQPYIVPVYFAYESGFIYVLSTLGQKIEWMRANPKVCIQVDQVANQSQWVSVIANGLYEELPEPQYAAERAHARELLEKRHQWWLHAMGERRAKSGGDMIEPLFFRIRVDSVTGLRAVAD